MGLLGVWDCIGLGGGTAIGLWAIRGPGAWLHNGPRPGRHRGMTARQKVLSEVDVRRLLQAFRRRVRADHDGLGGGLGVGWDLRGRAELSSGVVVVSVRGRQRGTAERSWWLSWGRWRDALAGIRVGGGARRRGSRRDGGVVCGRHPGVAREWATPGSSMEG